MLRTDIVVDGEQRSSAQHPMTPLVDVLRDEFGLTGTKVVCREGICGACTVHINGRPMASCLIPVGAVADREVCTIESVASGGELSPLQRTFEEHDVVQCGMCFPGMLMILTSFLAENPLATKREVQAALTGNVCRCTGYERLVDAVIALVKQR